MKVTAYLTRFADGAKREIEIPDHMSRRRPGEPIERYRSRLLSAAFTCGQNDFQPREGLPSVSVGDVIALMGEHYRVMSVGFRNLEGEDPRDKMGMDAADAAFAREVDA